MLLEIIVFIILFIFVFLGGHWLIYHSLKFFYSLAGPFKYFLAGLIFILPPCFIIFSGLTRKSETAVVHWLYLLITGWMGAAIYLVQGFALAWALFYLSKKNSWGIKRSYYANGVIGVVIIIMAYGLVSARSITLNRLEIEINNLPEEWQGKQVLFLSDVHLGSIARVDYLEKIIAQIKAVGPDYIMIGGDYLDGTCPGADKFIAPLQALSAGAKVYFVNGNHETYARISDLRAQLEQAGVTMLQDEIVVERGVQIAGLDYTHDRQNPANKKTISQIDASLPSILLSHEPVYVDEARSAGVDLHLSGHTHRGQIFPAGIVTRLIYGRHHYGLNQDGGYHQYTSSGAGTWGPPIRVLTKSELVVFTLK